MSKFENVITWLDSYREVAFDLLRIYLGIGLFIRGILFLLFPSTFAIILSPSTAWLASAPVYYAVTFIHVIGGALMAVGLLTRLAALAQIPILLGAVFFVHLQGGLFTADQSFEFAALVLFLLVLIFLYGSGRWSVDTAWENSFRPFQKYADRLNLSGNVAFELLRIYLGIGLLVRGVLYIEDSAAFVNLLGPSTSPSAQFASAALVHFVALTHLAGGALMAVGLLTRLAALAQIPILLGAVFFVHLQGGLFTADQSFEFAALVLFLLVLIFLYGSGRWSVDHYVAWEQAQPEADYAAQLRQERARRPEREPMASPAGTSSGGAVVAEPAVAEPPRKPTRAEPAPLTCPLLNDCPVVASEHPRDHPWVELTRRYSTLGGVYFVLGITGPPKEIVFRCKRCRQVIQKSQSREDLDYYKYR